jgi:hypothetical protein
MALDRENVQFGGCPPVLSQDPYMATIHSPAPKEILSMVEEELTKIGGRFAECTRHKGRLFLWATVPHTRQVRPNDHVQGGVAVCTIGHEICIFPHVFRPMCRSGAIMSHTDGIKRLKRVPSTSAPRVLERLRKRVRNLVQECTSSEMLTQLTDQLQVAAESDVDAGLQMSTVISQLPRRHSSLLLSQILSQFHEDEDESVYGLMNAVAAVARDEDDPETKWDLEELAGWVPMLVPSSQTYRDTTAVAVAS